MQGTDTLYLAHLPKFQLASHRSQLILTGTLDAQTMGQYQSLRNQNPNAYYLLENVDDATLDDLTKAGSSIGINIFTGSDTTAAPVLTGTLTIGEIVVQKSLLGGDLASTFPTEMPFYLYGTTSQQHIEHILVAASIPYYNQQLNSDQVKLQLDTELTADQLATGVCAVLSTVYEQAMQPMYD